MINKKDILHEIEQSKQKDLGYQIKEKYHNKMFRSTKVFLYGGSLLFASNFGLLIYNQPKPTPIIQQHVQISDSLSKLNLILEKEKSEKIELPYKNEEIETKLKILYDNEKQKRISELEKMIVTLDINKGKIEETKEFQEYNKNFKNKFYLFSYGTLGSIIPLFLGCQIYNILIKRKKDKELKDLELGIKHSF